MKTAWRIVVDILIVVLFLFFLLSLLYYRTGSLEMMPTEEDQGKIQVITMMGMVLFGSLCAVLTIIRATILRRGHKIDEDTYDKSWKLMIA